MGAGQWALMALVPVSALGLAHESLFRLPSCYLGPGSGLPQWAATLAGLAGGTAGLLGSSRLRHPGRALAWLLLSGSLLAGTLPFALLEAFARPGWFAVLALAAPALGTCCSAAVLTCAWLRWRPLLAAANGLAQALRPHFVLGGSAVLGFVVGGAAVIGLLRTGLVLALVLAVLAHAHAPVAPPPGPSPCGVGAHRRLGSLLPRGGAVLLFLLALWAFTWAEELVPLKDLQGRGGEVVYARRSPRSRFLVTSAQETFSLLVNGRLQVSTLDAYRYHEVLVHPAVAAAGEPRRALLLGGGHGLSERELLRYEGMEVTVVTPDAALADLGRRLPFLREQSARALSSPRLTLIEDEPLAWLEENPQPFEVILVDLPDPHGYLQSKWYTRYFYSQLRQHLEPRGSAAIQALSPLRSPRTFASILASVEAAGLFILPYTAPLPSFGQWGFVLASPSPLLVPSRVRKDLSFLTPAIQKDLFRRSRDLALASDSSRGALNLLADQILVEIFEGENGAEH